MVSKICFVVCPIGENGSETRRRSDQMLKYVHEPALAKFGYEIVRADKILKSGLITSQIINLIIEADLVIADLTDNNPNVYYELALRHATAKPFIQVAIAGQKIPFDISGLRTIFVDLTDPDSIESAKSDLDGHVKEFMSGHKADSPISLAKNVRLLQTDPDLAEKLLEHISNMSGSGFASLDDLDDKLDDIRNILDDLNGRTP
ncbi:hypothetical protein [Xanthomonas arboricola]|uniref:hypothetical protein n=1 Tax=Xanthomonas arboricola TaxID=56448 RepID=UPI000CC87659|nr:hypothetical protein [Xanthomonas arboricola]SOT93770.1 hypothetical protein CFBP6773_00295 [Xanthomonas arboricola pv. fragariae]